MKVRCAVTSASPVRLANGRTEYEGRARIVATEPHMDVKPPNGMMILKLNLDIEFHSTEPPGDFIEFEMTTS